MVSYFRSIIIQITAGSLYTFGIYSAAIKSSQSYSQQTLDTLSVFKDFGANTGIFSGLLYSAVTSNSGGWFGGPWVVLAVGAVLSFLGYFLMCLSVAGIIFQPPVIVMCLFMLVAAHGLTFVNTANVVTGVNNFADHRCTIVGIMKGFLGIEAQHEDSFNTSITYLVEGNQLMNDPNQLDEGHIHRRQHPGAYFQVPGDADDQTCTTDYRVQSGENLNLFQAMRSSDFWLLFLATSCGMGSGLALINNTCKPNRRSFRLYEV